MAVTVKIRPGDDFEKSLKLWKKLCMKEGIIDELKKRETYTPKSVKNRMKKKAAVARKMVAERKRKKFY
ncbi:MAG: 30S ribosomal protein S21 [Staphylococcus sp.]|nr:30S ribosomal protein S21 [Staphylococcus sp.]